MIVRSLPKDVSLKPLTTRQSVAIFTPVLFLAGFGTVKRRFAMCALEHLRTREHNSAFFLEEDAVMSVPYNHK